MIEWAKRHPLVSFYSLALTITWLAWMPQAAYSHGLFPFDSPIFYIIGGGPMLAAHIVLRVQHGKATATEKLFAPLFHWKESALYANPIQSFGISP